MIDSGSGISTTYYYDFIDRLAKYTEKGTDYSHSVEYGFDSKNNLSALKETINGITRETGYTYDADNRLDTLTAEGHTIDYTYDALGRVEKQEIKDGTEVVLTTTYTYYDSTETTTSTQVKSIQQTAENYSVTYTYTYDANGNILSISDGTNIITYEYDVNNQLIREDDPIANTSRIFQFRLSGQLFLETYVPYTTGEVGWDGPLIGYNADSTEWEDLLTAVGDKLITSDDIGNMLSFDGYTYTWEHGRELATMADSTGTWAFTYDANGMRTKKVKTNTSGTVTDTYAYVYNGSQLSQMKKNSNVLNFFYDGEGRPSYFTYGDAIYYYVTNLQGDVIAILDSTGTVMVNYHYDAYGVLLQIGGTMATTLGTLNPLTYRGYVYDHETGLYYLQSRYYNPAIRQFISPDAFVSTGQGYMGYNMFAYCGNNPVSRADPTGQSFEDLWELIKEIISNIGKNASSAAPVYSSLTTVAAADGPLPALDLAALAGAAVVTLSVAAYSIYETAKSRSIAVPKVETATESSRKSTPIYRRGGTNPGSLTPSRRDVALYPTTGKGLSFSLTPQPGSVMTTIEAINATGVVYAVIDGADHVSVFPVGGTLEDWHNAGASSIWTAAVKSVVVKWAG